MKDDIIKTILGIVKGSMLLVVAGVIFFNVYPKYSFRFQSGHFFRFNQMTGEIDHINDDGDWENFGKHIKRKS